MSQSASDADRPPYLAALTDWLACACAGANERAATAARASGDGLLADVTFVATAGHVLDFDDTFSDGVAHVTAACAPAALVLAAHLGLSLGAALDAYAAGFEAMAALAAASHPALYERGWHPTTVCGPLGAAVVAAGLLDLTPAQRENAIAISLLRAGGTRGAFGSDGKAIQVGLAAAAGVQGALLARGGASVDPRAMRGALGFEGVLGARWPQASGTPAGAGSGRAIDRNWIKLYASCLGTHSPIEAAAHAREQGYRDGGGQVEVRVHPVASDAANVQLASDGLSAKFSIQYCVAHTLAHGRPRVRDFAAIDLVTRDASRLVIVTVDESLPQFGAVLSAGAKELASVPSPPGSPDRPVSTSELAAKVADLAGDRLQSALANVGAPAADALTAAGLRGT